MSPYSGITVSDALFTNRRSLEAADEARAKKRLREKRMYHTAEGLRDEDEFGDMLIAALTANPEGHHVPSPVMMEHVAAESEPQAQITSHAPGTLVVGGYIANYYQ